MLLLVPFFFTKKCEKWRRAAFACVNTMFIYVRGNGTSEGSGIKILIGSEGLFLHKAELY